jgi:hypothetical protein
MRIKDVPSASAYLVFHDAFDSGAMDVYPCDSLAEAQDKATTRNATLDASGNDDCGTWRAYTKLPRVRVFKFHGGN